jgi:hypothetical protein
VTSRPEGATETARASSTERAPDRPEIGTTGSPIATQAPARDGTALQIDIRAVSLCWLSATVDGARVMSRLMQAGEQHTLEVHRDAVLRVGDPAAFAFSINGVAGRPIGRANEAVTVRITSENHREFLQ